jgi:hypothetical protein
MCALLYYYIAILLLDFLSLAAEIFIARARCVAARLVVA